MADKDIAYIAEIVKAALPYIDFGAKGMIELFVKVFEMMGTMKTLGSSSNLTASSFEFAKIDIEGLLNGIKPVCRDREREIVDRILSFFSMKRMFEMYNNMMETMKNMQGFGGFPFGDSGSGADTDSVSGNFGGLNFDSIFNSFKNSTATENSEPYTSSSEQTDFSKEETTGTDDDQPNYNKTGTKSNDMMFDMLKTMIPPDKISTFENLSMLLNSMSYDNNKPDNKEHSDG